MGAIKSPVAVLNPAPAPGATDLASTEANTACMTIDGPQLCTLMDPRLFLVSNVADVARAHKLSSLNG